MFLKDAQIFLEEAEAQAEAHRGTGKVGWFWGRVGFQERVLKYYFLELNLFNIKNNLH